MTKISFLYILLCLALVGTAKASERAFESFFNSDQIKPYKCGMNITYFLQYLDLEGELPEEGFVVSVHESYGQLNHFDARWGSSEKYEDGSTYHRSNWYFHVFAVLYGKVYDFSQTGPKVLSVLDYLNLSYIPKSRTQKIFFQGNLDAETEYKKYANLKLKIYNVDDYKIFSERPIYSGRFIELFEFYKTGNKIDLKIDPKSSVKINYRNKIENSDGSVTFSGLRAYKESKEYFIEHSSFEEVCSALGHPGSIPFSQNKFEIHSPSEYMKVYSYIQLSNPKTGDGPAINQVSGSVYKVSSINKTWNVMDEITCTSLWASPASRSF